MFLFFVSLILYIFLAVAIDLIVHHISEILRPGCSANNSGATGANNHTANNTHSTSTTVYKSTTNTTTTPKSNPNSAMIREH